MQAIQKIAVTLGIIVLLAVLLPPSPLQSLIQASPIAQEVAYINWFFPIGKCLVALTAWSLAISAYYLYAWVMRQLDVIQ